MPWLMIFNMDVILDSDLPPPHAAEVAVNINCKLLSIMAADALGAF